MEFLKMKKFRKALKRENSPVPDEDPESDEGKSVVDVDNDNDNDNGATTEEDDDDFIMNEVKRRLKELRRNSFMVLIPEEETCPEEDDDADDEHQVEEGGANCSNQWRDVEAEGRQLWSCFGAFYDKYCQRMLFFDRLTTQLLKEIGNFFHFNLLLL